MRKLALYLFTVVMVAAMFFPCAADVWAANPPKATDKVAPKSYLTIMAVDSAEIGQTIKITVSSSNKAVAKATVYAVNTDNRTLPFGNTTSSNNYAEIAAKTGILIGNTDAHGNVQYAFKNNGWYILVAVKDGFTPGIRKIAIGQITQIKQLVIKMPDSINEGETVRIGVYSRNDQFAVAGANIYALKLSVVAPTVSAITTNRKPEFQSNNPVSAQADNSDLPKMVAQLQPGIDEIKAKGIMLGETDQDGQLTHIFSDPGLYIIAAVEDGFIPGFGRMNVKQEDKNKLQIEAPNSVGVSENVTIFVYDRKGKAVEKAAVYVLKYKPVVLPGPAPTENGTATQMIIEARPKDVELKADVGLVIKTGILIGQTDGNGQIYYSFPEAGMYTIAANKEGYDPALARIEVRSLVAQNYLKIIVPATARVGQEITIKVVSRSNKGEAGVNVYIIKGNKFPISENTTSAAAAIFRPQVYADYAQSEGLLIGTTDENGKIPYKFSESGRFILVAIEDGFVPGFARVNVAMVMSNALSFKIPSHAVFGKQVTIQVLERKSNTPVADADVYAYQINGFADSVGHFFQETFSFGNSAREKYAGGVSEKGEYIGTTGNIGSLLYAFPARGTYVLVTFKSGYVPDFGRIEITAAESTQKNKTK